MEVLKIADLANYNKSFQELRKSFDEKINTISPFMGPEEFIKQELLRIKSIYMEPVEIRIGGDFRKTTGFNFTHYVQYGYDWLSGGVNYSIDQIVDGAAKGTDHPIHDREQFAKGIQDNLEKGVGLVLYEQFLKNQLQKKMEKSSNEVFERNVTVDPEHLNLSITTPDRVLRELYIIDTIFKSQYLRYDKTDPHPYLLDKSGHSGIDGRYLISVFLLSDVELFSLQGYKKEFTIRFESTSNLSLLRNQLIEIRDKAIEARDYYNWYLTRTNEIVDDFMNKSKSLDTPEHFQERLDFLESHRSVATISNYHIMEIYVGIDLHSKNGFWDRDKYTYTYLSDNSQLASICQKIIDFVDQFELVHQVPSISLNKQNNMPKYFETETRETFSKKYLKIFLQQGLDHEAVSLHLNKLHSVAKANVTIQQSGKVDLTVYPAKAYDISETREEVELTLNNYFRGNSVDPQFIEEPVSSVSEKAYYQVIDYMLMLGKNLERSKRLNEKLEEEWYRDYFIPYLNTISKKHTATGETFHSKGKTDILFLNNEGEPVLIAECKLWKGEKALLEAIDQLLNTYVNWRDEKIALIVFNRDVKKFSDIIETATKAIEGHKLCLKALGQRKDTSYSYFFRNPDDEKRIINLELVLFNVC